MLRTLLGLGPLWRMTTVFLFRFGHHVHFMAMTVGAIGTIVVVMMVAVVATVMVASMAVQGSSDVDPVLGLRVHNEQGREKETETGEEQDDGLHGVSTTGGLGVEKK